MTEPGTAFRLIVDERADGRRNMAIDHALLDGVARPGALPVLRLYGFAPPALSLGRFQHAHDILDQDAIWRDALVVVRRPSGGQAVLHDGELTYCAAIGREHLHPFSKREVYRLVAGILLRALERIGLDVRTAARRVGDLHHPDCFRTTGEYEVTDAMGRKLVGSAQLVSRTGALQHGSIPIDESNRTIARYLRPSIGQITHDSVSISSLLGRNPGFHGLRDAIAEGLSSALPVRPDGLDAFEREQVERRFQELYGRDEWNLTP